MPPEADDRGRVVTQQGGGVVIQVPRVEVELIMPNIKSYEETLKEHELSVEMGKNLETSKNTLEKKLQQKKEIMRIVEGDDMKQQLEMQKTKAGNIAANERQSMVKTAATNEKAAAAGAANVVKGASNLVEQTSRSAKNAAEGYKAFQEAQFVGLEKTAAAVRDVGQGAGSIASGVGKLGLGAAALGAGAGYTVGKVAEVGEKALNVVGNLASGTGTALMGAQKFFGRDSASKAAKAERKAKQQEMKLEKMKAERERIKWESENAIEAATLKLENCKKSKTARVTRGWCDKSQEKLDKLNAEKQIKDQEMANNLIHEEERKRNLEVELKFEEKQEKIKQNAKWKAENIGATHFLKYCDPSKKNRFAAEEEDASKNRTAAIEAVKGALQKVEEDLSGNKEKLGELGRFDKIKGVDRKIKLKIKGLKREKEKLEAKKKLINNNYEKKMIEIKQAKKGGLDDMCVNEKQKKEFLAWIKEDAAGKVSNEEVNKRLDALTKMIEKNFERLRRRKKKRRDRHHGNKKEEDNNHVATAKAKSNETVSGGGFKLRSQEKKRDVVKQKSRHRRRKKRRASRKII